MRNNMKDDKKKQSIEEEEEFLCSYISKSFRHQFNRAKLPISDLRKIYHIINKQKEK